MAGPGRGTGTIPPTASWKANKCGTACRALRKGPGGSMHETSTLSISPEKVCYIISKARQFEAKDVVADPESGSNAADDRMVDVLEDQADDPVYEEHTPVIRTLDEDEQADLIALTWHCRGHPSIHQQTTLPNAATP